MRLCIITSSVRKGDGQARVNYEITQTAIQRGHSVALIVRQKVANDLSSNQLVDCIDFSVDNIPTDLMREIVFTQQVNHWLRKNQHKFDVIMACGAVTSQKTDVNVVHFVHSTWLNSPFHTFRISKNFYGAYQWLYTLLNSFWEKQAFKSTKILIAVSETVKQELMEIGFPEEKIQVILNGVDLNEFVPNSLARDQFGLPQGVNLALFVGDFRTNRKNLDSVLKALVDVPNLHLAVVGNVEGSPYPQLAKQLKVDTRVHFLGYRSDVAKIMQTVDFFVFPSRYEPFGMVVSEAMASGLPVITTSVSGVAAIVTPESGIVLTDSEDVPSLVDALVLLTDRPEIRIQMGKSARAIAEQHSWIGKANSYIDLFESLRS